MLIQDLSPALKRKLKTAFAASNEYDLATALRKHTSVTTTQIYLTYLGQTSTYQAAMRIWHAMLAATENGTIVFARMPSREQAILRGYIRDYAIVRAETFSPYESFLLAFMVYGVRGLAEELWQLWQLWTPQFEFPSWKKEDA
jgi:hypothetical protein